MPWLYQERMSVQSVNERLTLHTPVEYHISKVQTQASPYLANSQLCMHNYKDSLYHRSAFQIWTWADQLGWNVMFHAHIRAFSPPLAAHALLIVHTTVLSCTPHYTQPQSLNDWGWKWYTNVILLLCCSWNDYVFLVKIINTASTILLQVKQWILWCCTCWLKQGSEKC